jgi:hypothetical protein
MCKAGAYHKSCTVKLLQARRPFDASLHPGLRLSKVCNGETKKPSATDIHINAKPIDSTSRRWLAV